MFTHHKLIVYEKALSLAANAGSLAVPWGKRHAIVDHFRRASESIVFNIAEGGRLQAGADKARMLDYSLGSTFECGACLDIACIKTLLAEEQSLAEKIKFLEVCRMLIGLRKAWKGSVLHEEPVSYGTPESGVIFNHESLHVYQVGLDFMRWFVALPGVKELSDGGCREIDRMATSMVLNIAEGNGRYSELDHRRFLDIAAASAVKTAVYLDLYQQRALPTEISIEPGRNLLGRVVAMLNAF